jgi:uncharacterized membrane protein YgcG
MSDFRGPTREKICLDHNKLRLGTPCPTAEGKWSGLVWGIHKNNPRITVYTGDPADNTSRTNNGAIRAELDAGLLMVVINLLREANKAEAGWKKCLKNFNYTFFGGKRSDKPVNTSDVWIGKDKEGLTYISVIDATNKERPVIKFNIAPAWTWAKLYHADGQQFSKEEASTIFTEGYANLLEQLYTQLIVKHYVPFEPNKDGGGNNRGGGGRSSGGGGYGGGDRQGSGGYSRGNDSNAGTDDGDDDIPF